MSLIVEDGTIVAGAESYISVTDASTYHSNRGNTAWAALTSDAVREQCLRKATDYMLQAYRGVWKGQRVSSAQALDWPRYSVYTEDLDAPLSYGDTAFLVASNIVPTEVKNACAELALKSATASLNPDLGKDIISQTVGPISTTYKDSSPQQKRYQAIDMMLRPYLDFNGVNIRVVRS